MERNRGPIKFGAQEIDKQASAGLGHFYLEMEMNGTKRQEMKCKLQDARREWKGTIERTWKRMETNWKTMEGKWKGVEGNGKR